MALIILMTGTGEGHQQCLPKDKDCKPPFILTSLFLHTAFRLAIGFSDYTVMSEITGWYFGILFVYLLLNILSNNFVEAKK